MVFAFRNNGLAEGLAIDDDPDREGILDGRFTACCKPEEYNQNGISFHWVLTMMPTAESRASNSLPPVVVIVTEGQREEYAVVGSLCSAT